jgi:hypothetical protein
LKYKKKNRALLKALQEKEGEIDSLHTMLKTSIELRDHKKLLNDT